MTPAKETYNELLTGVTRAIDRGVSINVGRDGDVRLIQVTKDKESYVLRIAPMKPGPAPMQETPPPSPLQGYSGDICPNCHGARMVRTGTCATCQDCGSTRGCG